MTIIEELLNRHEDKTLEFKQDLSSSKTLLKTLVAFANTAGGTLVIGVSDNKKIIGVDDPLSAEEKLTSLIADHIEPFLLPTIKIINHKTKSLIVVEVPYFASGGPFYLKQLGKDKGVMIRLGSSSRAASAEMIQELTHVRHAQSFDAMPCVNATVDDLDHELLEKIFANTDHSTSKAKLKTLKILVPYGDDYIPSNAGIILFSKKAVREKLFPMAYVSCARFAGNEKVDFLDRMDIDRVIEAVEIVPQFIRRNTRMGAVIKDIKRKDIPEYPAMGVREGLLNALMHADYAYSTMRIFVSIFDNRLEIRSPGCLPPGMTIASIKDGVSIPRNLVIARIFEKLGWVERFGTGYSRIVKSCAQYDYPLPEWYEVGPYTDIVFKPLAMEHIHESQNRLGPNMGLSRDLVTNESFLHENELKLLIACHQPKSIGVLMQLLQWKNRTKFRNRFITPLITRGLLVMTVPEKPNSRLQRYQTTIIGKEKT